MMQLDEVLIERSVFLQPASFADKSLEQITAKDYRPYERILQEGGVLGVFNTRFRFVTDHVLTKKYEYLSCAIAEAMLKDHKHPDHKLFHLASMERGSLQVSYEWDVRSAASVASMRFDHALQLKHLLRIETLLVLRPDLPTYDILVPQGVPSILASLAKEDCALVPVDAMTSVVAVPA